MLETFIYLNEKDAQKEQQKRKIMVQEKKNGRDEGMTYPFFLTNTLGCLSRSAYFRSLA